MPDELRLSIEKLVYGGDGLGHADGNTIFVPYVLPGEEVRAAEKSKKKKVVWAKLLEVTSASAERTAAPCPHFETCGGCHYQHITAGAQVRLKKDILRETLSRLGGISWTGAIEEGKMTPFPSPWTATIAPRRISSSIPRCLNPPIFSRMNSRIPGTENIAALLVSPHPITASR